MISWNRILSNPADADADADAESESYTKNLATFMSPATLQFILSSL